MHSSKQYLIVLLFAILYYVTYNALQFASIYVGESFFQLNDFSIANAISGLVTLVLLVVILKRVSKILFIENKYLFRHFLVVIVVSFLFKIFKDPFLSYYEIVGVNDITQMGIEKGKFNLSNHIYYLLYFIVLVPITEELMFRGFLLKKLIDNNQKRVYPVLFVSVLFALIHINFYSFLFTDSILLFSRTFIFGVITSIIFIRMGENIIYPILLHVMNNLLAFIFDNPMSYEYFEMLRYLSFDILYWLIIIFSGVCIFYILKKVT